MSTSFKSAIERLKLVSGFLARQGPLAADLLPRVAEKRLSAALRVEVKKLAIH